MFTCNFEGCSAEFKKLWQLQEHIVKHTGQRPFKCDVEGCEKAYTRKTHLQRHQQTHSGLKGFVCSEKGCGQAFTLRDNLKKHIKRIHAKDKLKIKCDFDGCGKVFRKKQALKIHQYEHTNIKPFRCTHDGCESSFMIPSKLKRHMKQHEGYKCTKEGCTIVFEKWSQLRKHVANDHVTEFQCDLCKKTFSKRYKLRVHLKYHKDTKEVFMCARENCQYTSLRMCEMDLHISNYHEGARPFVCQYKGCTKTFVHKQSKMKHQIVHSPGYVKPQPKPKRKRGVSSILADYPDEATRGPRQSCQEDIQSEMEITQGKHTIEENSATSSAVCDITDGIQTRTNSNQCNVDIAVDGTKSQTKSSIVAASDRSQDISMEYCCVGETVKHVDIDLGSSVVIANETQTTVVDNSIADDFRDECQIHSIPTETDMETPASVSHNPTEEAVQETDDNIVVSDIETGADDLDTLIRAVTKNRNKTTKNTFSDSAVLKDHVIVS